MVHDLYAGPMAARMMSVLMTVMAITPLIGPSVGGLILHLSSWRAIFICLVVIGILILLAVTRLPETLTITKRSSSSLLHALLGYQDLVKHGRLMVYVAIGGSFYGAMFAYVAGTPHAYISYYDVSPQHYGLLFALGIVGIMFANQLNSRWVAKFGIHRMIRFGTLIASIAGTASVLIVSNPWFGLCRLVISLFIFVSATGLIIANSLVGAMSVFSQRSGAVSGLVGATQYGTGVLGSACVGIFSDGSPLAMVCTIAVFTALSLCFSMMLKEPSST